MSHDVFISHSAKDKTVADATCACLEQRGIRCWVAPRDIVAGSDWSASIIDGINGASVMVLILSKHSNVSKQVIREIERAANRGIPILPFRVDDTVLSKSLEYFLSSAHWLDAFDGEMQRHLDLLGNNVAQILSREDAIRGVAPPPAGRKQRNRLVMVWAACAAGLLAICGAVFLARQWQVTPRPSDVSPQSASMTAAPLADEVAIGAKAKLGFVVSPLKEVVAQRLGAGEGGMWVAKVLPSQAADIKRGDIILQIGDTRLLSIDDYESIKSKLEIGASYELDLIRDGVSKRVQFTPVGVPSEKLLSYEGEFDDALPFGVNEILETAITNVYHVEASSGTVLALELGNVAAWRREGSGHQRVTLPEGQYSCGNVSADGSLIVLAERDTGAVLGIKVRTGQVILDTGPLNATFAELVISHDNAFIIALAKDGEVHVIDAEQQEVGRRADFRALARNNGISWEALKDACLSSGGRFLLTVHTDGCLLWDWRDDSLARAYRAESPLRGAALSQDGTRVAIFLESGGIEVWDNIEQKKVATLRGHERGGFFDWGEVAFLSPRYLASGCYTDRSIRIWDCETRSSVWEVEPVNVFCLRFDGSQSALYAGRSSRVDDVAIPEFLGIGPGIGPAADPDLPSIEGAGSGGAQSSFGWVAASSITATFGDGSSREVSESHDGATMTTERDASGEITAMSFQPAPGAFGLGIEVGVGAGGISPITHSERFTEGARVVDLPVGGQAARDGVIRKGDLITAVIEREGAKPIPLTGLFLAEFEWLVVGKEGTKIRLLLRRDGDADLVEVLASRGRMQAVRNRAVQSDFTNSIGMDFVAVAGGIGSLGIDQQGDATMAPHYVRITKGFLIGAHEVTQDEFAAVMSSRPSSFSQGGQKAEDVGKAYDKGAIPSADTSHHPVESVSWEDANEFCRLLSDREGRSYRLPTEAEWEWACRNAGRRWWKGEFHPAGNGLDEEAVGRHLDFPVTPYPVGSRSPNDGGIHDMLGNVAEWCADVFADDGFATAAFVDPKGPVEGLKRVVRGGSFKDNESDFFKRASLLPTEKRPYVGFRVVLEPAVGMLADKGLEHSILDTSRWEIDESVIPDPIPAIQGSLRAMQEEEQEAKEIEQAVTEGTALGELREQIITSACRNQSQFDNIKHMYPKVCARMGDRSVPAAYADYEAAKGGQLLVFYEQARSKDPLLGWACNDLAWALATSPDERHRDPAVAVARAVEACQITKWQYWGFLDTLAAALAAAGRYESAGRVAKAALERAPEDEKAQLEYAIDRYSQGLTWAARKP